MNSDYDVDINKVMQSDNEVDKFSVNKKNHSLHSYGNIAYFSQDTNEINDTKLEESVINKKSRFSKVSEPLSIKSERLSILRSSIAPLNPILDNSALSQKSGRLTGLRCSLFVNINPDISNQNSVRGSINQESITRMLENNP